MRLVEAILDANHRALRGDSSAGLRPAEFAASLPLVALTCIDPRLNALMPGVLGIPEDQFIWLRNAGNIIFDPLSSMTRSIAMACAIKGGREIAIIGHTDCKVSQTSVLQLTEHFKAFGVPRSNLPENLTEFFGLFASERQNVMRGVELVRSSPLIGPKVPVHGLVVDVANGRLELVVNGYQALETAGARAPAPSLAPAMTEIGHYSALSIGEPAVTGSDDDIGSAATRSPAVPPVPRMEARPEAEAQPPQPTPTQAAQPRLRIDPGAQYKIMDAARKVLGPVSGQDLERWIAEGRVDLTTLAQKLGYKEWRPLAALIDKEELPSIPIPPPLAAALRFGLDKKKERRKEH